MVMDDLETNCIEMLSFKPLFVYRNVDDIIMCIQKKIQETIDIFNDYDERLQFTYEIESNDSINFLDALIIIENDRLIIDWCRKPIFSGRTVNYHTRHPFSRKIAIIYIYIYIY